MNPFRFLKEEKGIIFENRIRWEREDEKIAEDEEEKLREVIEEEKRKLEEERNGEDFIDKIEPLKDVRNHIREKHDKKRIEELTKKKKLEFEMRRQTIQAKRDNELLLIKLKKVAIIFAMVFVALAIVVFSVVIIVNVINSNGKEKYNNAIKYLQSDNYYEAEKMLENSSYKDSEALYDYCAIMADIEKYKGKDEAFTEQFIHIKDELTNSEVKAKYEDDYISLLEVNTINDYIDELYSKYRNNIINNGTAAINVELNNEYIKKARILKDKIKYLDKDFMMLIDESKLDQIIEGH